MGYRKRFCWFGENSLAIDLEFKQNQRSKLCKVGFRRGLQCVRGGELMATQPINRLIGPQRCFSCDELFKDSDQIALISTEMGWVCEVPGDIAKYAVWEPGDVEAFHRACWEQLGITKAGRC